jgi:hypothetical protein
MTNMNVTEQLNTMQRMFRPDPTILEAARKSACCFWESQDKILDSMQTFANGWFQRRHAGTHAVLEAAERICKAETPIDLLREYQEWASGAFQRVIADGLACQQQAMEIVAASGQPLVRLTGEKELAALQSEMWPFAPSKAA